MTERTYENKPVELVMADPADLSRFHRGVGVKNSACLRCGTTLWQLMGDPAMPVSAIPMMEASGNISGDGIPVITLICANCGTLWTQSLQIIQEWLSQNPKPPEGP